MIDRVLMDLYFPDTGFLIMYHGMLETPVEEQRKSRREKYYSLPAQKYQCTVEMVGRWLGIGTVVTQGGLAYFMFKTGAGRCCFFWIKACSALAQTKTVPLL